MSKMPSGMYKIVYIIELHPVQYTAGYFDQLCYIVCVWETALLFKTLNVLHTITFS